MHNIFVKPLPKWVHCLKSLSVTEDFKIPIPPLEVQSEIVRILDKFTELTARKKQYEYYRDLLLTFDDGQIEWKTISSVADSFTGLTYKPTDKSDVGLLVLRSSNIKNSRLAFDDCVFVQMDKIPE